MQASPVPWDYSSRRKAGSATDVYAGGVQYDSLESGAPMITRESGIVHEANTDVTAFLDNTNIFPDSVTIFVNHLGWIPI